MRKQIRKKRYRIVGRAGRLSDYKQQSGLVRKRNRHGFAKLTVRIEHVRWSRGRYAIPARAFSTRCQKLIISVEI